MSNVHHPSCSDIACTCPPRWHALKDAEARIAELEAERAYLLGEAASAHHDNGEKQRRIAELKALLRRGTHLSGVENYNVWVYEVRKALDPENPSSQEHV